MKSVSGEITDGLRKIFIMRLSRIGKEFIPQQLTVGGA